MSGGTVKAALVVALTTAFAADGNVHVVAGEPGLSAAPDIIALADVTSADDGEEETFTIEMVVSCYVGGGDEAQATATARAYALLTTTASTIYANPTLGGACRVVRLNRDHRGVDGIAYEQGLPVGRLCEITAQITCWSGRPVVGSLQSAQVVP